MARTIAPQLQRDVAKRDVFLETVQYFGLQPRASYSCIVAVAPKSHDGNDGSDLSDSKLYGKFQLEYHPDKAHATEKDVFKLCAKAVKGRVCRYTSQLLDSDRLEVVGEAMACLLDGILPETVEVTTEEDHIGQLELMVREYRSKLRAFNELVAWARWQTFTTPEPPALQLTWSPPSMSTAVATGNQSGGRGGVACQQGHVNELSVVSLSGTTAPASNHARLTEMVAVIDGLMHQNKFAVPDGGVVNFLQRLSMYGEEFVGACFAPEDIVVILRELEPHRGVIYIPSAATIISKGVADEVENCPGELILKEFRTINTVSAEQRRLILASKSYVQANQLDVSDIQTPLEFAEFCAKNDGPWKGRYMERTAWEAFGEEVFPNVRQLLRDKYRRMAQGTFKGQHGDIWLTGTNEQMFVQYATGQISKFAFM